ncbi:hypothetical protein J1614_009835 [Plenodomus biglobosus]|nr:hypothetical protein J1614_009835 [Plenodomus biglobosus]
MDVLIDLMLGHINNLYNTTFWTLVQQGGMDPRAAEQRLSGTISSDKNELLFKEFGINYNKEPECFKKAKALSSPTVAEFPLPPLAHPQPRKVSPHLVTRSVEKAVPLLKGGVIGPESLGQGPGPTFLSTTSTPSPPPSPMAMSKPAFPNPLRSNPVSARNSTYPPVNTLSSSPSSAVTSPQSSMVSQTMPQFPPLMPLPLSPLTLKPSTKPPMSLKAPNPTTRTNFSPTSPPTDFPITFPISGYTHKPPFATNHMASHSASASMSTSTPSSGPPLTHQNKLKHRSPSQPLLPSYVTQHNYSASGPPSIPLRMSSIPANNKPRKLSLQNSRSNTTLKAVESSNDENEMWISPIHTSGSTTPKRISPPLRTNKELPSPPLSYEEELRTREKVKSNSSSPQQGSPPQLRDEYSHQHHSSESDNTSGRVWGAHHIAHASIDALPANTSTPPDRRGISHSRLDSTSTSTSFSYLHHGPDVQALSSSTGSTSKNSESPTLQPIASTNGSLDMDDLLSSPPIAPIRDSSRAKPKASQTSPTATTKDKGKEKVKEKDNKHSPSPTAPPKKPQKPNSSTTSKSKPTHTVPPKKPTEHRGWTSATHALSTENRPVQMSRTQKDKDRKKRSKAQIIMEHVDIIKDEFWEKRPWILSGKTG